MKVKPLRFIGEMIRVEFDQPPLLEKKPGCPDRFHWRGQSNQILQVLSEWHDYRRRGKMKLNMTPAHAEVASRRGSWGVGRFYFRVLTRAGRIFDLYYDRAPKDVNDRKGSWFLYRELVSTFGSGGDGDDEFQDRNGAKKSGGGVQVVGKTGKDCDCLETDNHEPDRV